MTAFDFMIKNLCQFIKNRAKIGIIFKMAKIGIMPYFATLFEICSFRKMPIFYIFARQIANFNRHIINIFALLTTLLPSIHEPIKIGSWIILQEPTYELSKYYACSIISLRTFSNSSLEYVSSMIKLYQVSACFGNADRLTCECLFLQH